MERLWGQRKSAVAADRLAGSIEELNAAARRLFTDLASHPVKLRAPREVPAVLVARCDRGLWIHILSVADGVAQTPPVL